MSALVIAEAIAQLQIFGSVPSWAAVHAASDAYMAPLIEPGDIAVIDCRDTAVESGGVFLIENGQRLPLYSRRRRIITVRHDVHGWWCSPWSRARSNDEARARVLRGMLIHMADGPYRCVSNIGDMTIGRVVGLYQPTSRRTDV